MKIRKAEEKDIPRLLALLGQVLQIHAEIRPDVFISGTTKYTVCELAELLKREDKPIYVAVNEDDVCMGYAFCQVQKQPFLQDQKELTEKECRKLIVTAIAEGKEQLALCIETIACTGIRISEIKYFTVERVKAGKIEIYNKGKYRRIFLPKILQKKLLSYCHNNQIAEGWIFVTKNGKLKDRSNIWREMKRLKEKAGVAESKIFPHNFRHLFARIYYKVTKDITGLADLLGHSSINVTRIYTATTETVFQKKLDKIVEQEILECTT